MNHVLSPSIYLRLSGASVTDGNLILTNPTEEAEELVLVMKRVDTSHMLFYRLMQSRLNEEDAFTIGQQIANDLKKVRQDVLSVYSYYEISGRRVTEIRVWMKSVDEYISSSEVALYCDFMDAYRDKHKKEFDNAALEHAGDTHSLNALFTENTLYLMDTFLPKEDWLTEHSLIPPYRMAADLWALGGSRVLLEAFLRGYTAAAKVSIDRVMEPFFIMYAATIMVSYLYMLQRTDPSMLEAAHRYHDFLRNYFGQLNVA